MHQYSCEDTDTRLNLLQSSEPESNRKQGGAFAVFSPRTAAVYEDGANGGKQATIPGPNSVRHSKQMDEQEEDGQNGSGRDLILPHFGLSNSRHGTEDPGEEDAEDEEN